MSGFLRFWVLLGLICGGVAAQTAPDVPRPAPELAVKLTTGAEFKLSSLRGSVVAVEFVYTTCPHCQHTVQTTGKLLNEYGPKGFRAVAVAFNDGADLLAPEFVTQFGVNFPVGTGTSQTLFDFTGPPTRRFTLPVLLFVDRKGMLRGQFTGDESFFKDEEANMRQWIETLLKEPGPQAANHKKKPRK